MRSILTNVTIDAPPAAVWRVLVDFPAYSRWNPFIRHIEGNMRVGAKLRVTVEPPGRRPMTFRPIVRVVDTARELRWLGRVVDGLRGLHPIDFPISAESMQICTRWSVADSSRIATRHGVDFRPSSETVVDMIRSLHATGHVSDFLAGGLARKGR